MGKFYPVILGENALKGLLCVSNGKRKQSILKTYLGFMLTVTDLRKTIDEEQARKRSGHTRAIPSGKT